MNLYIHAVFCLTALNGTGVVAASDPVRVFILAGQSNMEAKRWWTWMAKTTTKGVEP